MAKIQLSHNAKLEIEDDGNIIKTFSVTFKEPTKKEKKKLGKGHEEIIKVFTDAQSLAKKAEVLESKVAALKELGKSDQLLEATSKLEYIYNNQDDLESKFEELGGFDKLLEASKISYDTSVGGKDKEALAEFAENESSYSDVMDAIRQDIKDSRKK